MHVFLPEMDGQDSDDGEWINVLHPSDIEDDVVLQHNDIHNGDNDIHGHKGSGEEGGDETDSEDDEDGEWVECGSEESEMELSDDENISESESEDNSHPKPTSSVTGSQVITT